MAPPKEITPEQKRNMKFSEDRFQLLEDIHEMIGKELDSGGYRGGECRSGKSRCP